MSILKISAAALLVSSVAFGQVQMPLPTFTNTYTATAGTRGFYFQAPTTFAITGLRVPDEAKTGTQNVAVYSLKTKPGSNVTAKPIFYAGGVKSSTIIATNLVITQGSWVVILGCGGDAKSQKNSYGAGAFTSNVLSNKVVLNRIWTNTNLITLKGGGAFNASTGSIGRVEVYVKAVKGVATSTDFGLASTNKPIGASPNMGMAKFLRTYSASTATRGFYFQAPTTFVITGLRVPDETKAGLQAVSLYVTAKAPPAWSASAAMTLKEQKFFSAGQSSSKILPAKIVVTKGQWVGVLGACYSSSSTTLKNSYGGPAGAYSSSILSNAVTIKRFLMQASIVGNKGIGSVSTEDAGNIGRIEIHIAGQASAGTIFPSLTTTGRPGLGLTPKLEVKGLPGSQVGVLFMGAGRMPAPLPTVFGKLLIKPPFFLSIAVTGGTGSVPLTIPNDPKLASVILDFQTLDLNLSTTTFGMSNGTEWTIGN